MVDEGGLAAPTVVPVAACSEDGDRAEVPDPETEAHVAACESPRAFAADSGSEQRSSWQLLSGCLHSSCSEWYLHLSWRGEYSGGRRPSGHSGSTDLEVVRLGNLALLHLAQARSPSPDAVRLDIELDTYRWALL